MTKFTGIVILAAVAPFFASPALAAPSINFSIQTTPLATPTFEYKFKGGKYVWVQKSAITQFTASADTNDNQLLWKTALNIDSLGIGGVANFTGKVPTNVTSWSQSGPITFPVSFLAAYQANFAAFCESNGGGEQVVKHGLSIIFSARQGYLPKPKGWPEQVPQQIDSEKWAFRTVSMPVKVVCGPKPASTQPRPGGLVQEKGKFRVTSIEHRYMTVVGDVTKPNAATQCKRTRLSVTLKTNQAGPVKFRLHKKVGNGPTQTKAVEIWASHQNSGPFKGLFVANHQEWITVEKTTAVQTMAEDLVNPIGLTTQWKSITLHCTGAGGGGLAGAPSNSGPGGKPKVDPKPVFEGFGSFSIGKPKETHSQPAPKKPVQTKTAPVAPRKPVQTKTAPARHSGAQQDQPQGRIGQLLPAIQKVR